MSTELPTSHNEENPLQPEVKNTGLFAVAAESLPHPERPNQDAYINDPENGIFAVFDGVGGVEGGREAALLTQEYVWEQCRELQLKMRTGRINISNVQKELLEIAIKINQKVRELPQTSLTTMSLAFICRDKEDQLYCNLVHTGDSRIYFYKNSKLSLQTNDESWTAPPEEGSQPMTKEVQDRIRERWGERNVQLIDLIETKTDEKMIGNDPILQQVWANRASIAGSIGQNIYPTVQVRTAPLDSNTSILLATDGVTDNLTWINLETILTQSDEPEQVIKKIIAAAQSVAMTGTVYGRDDESVRAKVDDTTAIFVKLKDVGGSELKVGSSIFQRIKNLFYGFRR